jgi:hypothetical protein
VQVERVLGFEIERRSRNFEESEAGAIIHLEEGVKRTTLIDFEGTDQAKTEEILVKGPSLLRIPTTIGIMVQTLDHKKPPLAALWR